VSPIDFHPTVRRWFEANLGQPSAPQAQGWPAIARGEHVLIAAPTGSGKTLAAFLWSLDRLLAAGRELPRATQVVYVSPLKALSNDVQKNLLRPLAEMRALDPELPEVAVQVRTGDTPQKEREAMLRSAPHVLVTTPESLYLLLTTERGRKQLATVRTLVVDEIHALARDKRGSHFALTAEDRKSVV
jgi:ATP-dependent Lhr-like helicase